MRSSEELLKAWEEATVDNPIVLASGESDNFCKAMKIIGAQEDSRLGRKSLNIELVDRDFLLKDGVLSPLDQKSAFHNRHDWAEHLKRNGCVEIGNDFNNATQKKREVVGDFDCRRELAQATHQVMEKYGH